MKGITQITNILYIVLLGIFPHSYLNAQNSNSAISMLGHIKKMEELNKVNFIYENGLLDSMFIAGDFVYEGTINDQLERTMFETTLTYKLITKTTIALFPREEYFLQGKIRDENNNPLVGATILIQGVNKGTSSDLNGEYKILIPKGWQRLQINYVGYKEYIDTIEINRNFTNTKDYILKDLPPLENIVVVGIKLRAVSLLENTSAVDVIDVNRLPFSSNSELGQLLHSSMPSFHSTHQTISDGTDHIDPATLRGLGSDQVLVLINGKRRHHSSLVNVNGTIGRGSVATDLNAIPIAAVDRIEILRDGASTQYGSDAIAGVINIVLKKNTEFTAFNGLVGTSTRADGQNLIFNGNSGIKLGENGGFLNLTLDFNHRGSVDRSGDYTGVIFGDGRDLIRSERSLFFKQIDLKDDHVMSVGQAESTNSGLFLNFELPLSNSFQLYSFGGINFKDGNSTGFYRFPYQELKQSGIYPLGFLPGIEVDIFDQSLSSGIKGKLNLWKLDFSNSYGRNSFFFNINNSNNASMGLSSPSTTSAGGFNYTQNVTNLDVQRSFKESIISDLGFGFESKIENYNQQSGDRQSWDYFGETNSNGVPKEAGFQVFPGFRPENEVSQNRLSFGIYSDLESNVTDKLLIGAAARLEFYEDFGNRLSWKISSRYKINKKIFFRTNINTGFRAPSMPQTHFSSTAIQFISQGQDQVGSFVTHFNNTSPTARDFGIDPLKAETSLNYSSGISINLPNNLSITTDVYHISIKDRIVTTGRFSAEDVPKFKEILEPINVSQAQFFANAIDTKTMGLDLSVKYNLKFFNNELIFSGSGNLTNTFIDENEDGSKKIKSSSFLEPYKDVLFNREEISRIEVAQPKSKLLLNVIYKRKRMEAFLGFTRFGTVEYIHPEDGEIENWVLNEMTGNMESRDQVFSPKWITDINLNYIISNQIHLIVGGTNIFNVFPDKHKHSANTNHGIFPYSRRVSQFGLRGAYTFVKIGVRL